MPSWKMINVRFGCRLPSYVLRHHILTHCPFIHPEIPKESYFIQQPVFYGAATQDHLCVAALFDRGFAQFAKGPLTKAEFGGDHWLILSHANEINEKLEGWLEGL